MHSPKQTKKIFLQPKPLKTYFRAQNGPKKILRGPEWWRKLFSGQNDQEKGFRSPKRLEKVFLKGQEIVLKIAETFKKMMEPKMVNKNIFGAH